MRRLMIATALLLVAPLVAAQAYKWKDANGTVHYSDAPPPQGTKYNKVTTSGSVEPLAAPPAQTASTEPSSDAAKPATPQQPMADTPENRAKLCTTLKANMDTLKGSGPVIMEEGGQQKVINADQRQQQQATSQAQYQQYCSGT
ncbi:MULTISPECIES: DUF4124 domain-containing protein [Dyella]|uniref:DUF4124 domain-containing protein n=1 Tax=Dyella TaxID=231454 RepID=UPI000C85C13B|nr:MULTISPECIES: DUF4124 domain-containing protein [Dyella]MDR3445363.1 DUF4124 domain-containing protein [Dyella sp.]PMQ07022.1 hypothetical protein DyAD56_02425 [Dyella sp. AD56]ULU27310.1 DUF4124 protein [Dyella terrae]